MSSVFFVLAIVAVISPVTLASRPSHNHLDVDPEALVRTDPGQSVAMLNRHTFNSSVQQDLVDHWVVLFCVDWLDHCQSLWHDYRRMAAHWEKVMGPAASSWQSTAVRFAEVDCAVDKALCNENNVQMYPSVVHFKGGKFDGEWELSEDATSLSRDVSKWVGKVLQTKPAMMRAEASNSKDVKSLGTHLRELATLLSWKDPTTAAIGYFILAASVGLLAWILGTGLELDWTSIACFANEAKSKKWPSALLPELPEMPPPRTIVRSSLEL
jgi:thioredoxin-like negative regulator of GroEL